MSYKPLSGNVVFIHRVGVLQNNKQGVEIVRNSLKYLGATVVDGYADPRITMYLIGTTAQRATPIGWTDSIEARSARERNIPVFSDFTTTLKNRSNYDAVYPSLSTIASPAERLKKLFGLDSNNSAYSQFIITKNDRATVEMTQLFQQGLQHQFQQQPQYEQQRGYIQQGFNPRQNYNGQQDHYHPHSSTTEPNFSNNQSNVVHIAQGGHEYWMSSTKYDNQQQSDVSRSIFDKSEDNKLAQMGFYENDDDISNLDMNNDTNFLSTDDDNQHQKNQPKQNQKDRIAKQKINLQDKLLELQKKLQFIRPWKTRYKSPTLPTELHKSLTFFGGVEYKRLLDQMRSLLGNNNPSSSYHKHHNSNNDLLLSSPLNTLSTGRNGYNEQLSHRMTRFRGIRDPANIDSVINRHYNLKSAHFLISLSNTATNLNNSIDKIQRFIDKNNDDSGQQNNNNNNNDNNNNNNNSNPQNQYLPSYGPMHSTEHIINSTTLEGLKKRMMVIHANTGDQVVQNNIHNGRNIAQNNDQITQKDLDIDISIATDITTEVNVDDTVIQQYLMGPYVERDGYYSLVRDDSKDDEEHSQNSKENLNTGTNNPHYALHTSPNSVPLHRKMKSPDGRIFCVPNSAILHQYKYTPTPRTVALSTDDLTTTTTNNDNNSVGRLDNNNHHSDKQRGHDEEEQARRKNKQLDHLLSGGDTRSTTHLKFEMADNQDTLMPLQEKVNTYTSTSEDLSKTITFYPGTVLFNWLNSPVFSPFCNPTIMPEDRIHFAHVSSHSGSSIKPKLKDLVTAHINDDFSHLPNAKLSKDNIPTYLPIGTRIRPVFKSGYKLACSLTPALRARGANENTNNNDEIDDDRNGKYKKHKKTLHPHETTGQDHYDKAAANIPWSHITILQRVQRIRQIDSQKKIIANLRNRERGSATKPNERNRNQKSELYNHPPSNQDDSLKREFVSFNGSDTAGLLYPMSSNTSSAKLTQQPNHNDSLNTFGYNNISLPPLLESYTQAPISHYDQLSQCNMDGIQLNPHQSQSNSLSTLKEVISFGKPSQLDALGTQLRNLVNTDNQMSLQHKFLQHNEDILRKKSMELNPVDLTIQQQHQQQKSQDEKERFISQHNNKPKSHNKTAGRYDSRSDQRQLIRGTTVSLIEDDNIDYSNDQLQGLNPNRTRIINQNGSFDPKVSQNLQKKITTVITPTTSTPRTTDEILRSFRLPSFRALTSSLSTGTSTLFVDSKTGSNMDLIDAAPTTSQSVHLTNHDQNNDLIKNTTVGFSTIEQIDKDVTKVIDTRHSNNTTTNISNIDQDNTIIDEWGDEITLLPRSVDDHLAHFNSNNIPYHPDHLKNVPKVTNQIVLKDPFDDDFDDIPVQPAVANITRRDTRVSIPHLNDDIKNNNEKHIEMSDDHLPHLESIHNIHSQNEQPYKTTKQLYLHGLTRDNHRDDEQRQRNELSKDNNDHNEHYNDDEEVSLPTLHRDRDRDYDRHAQSDNNNEIPTPNSNKSAHYGSKAVFDVNLHQAHEFWRFRIQLPKVEDDKYSKKNQKSYNNNPNQPNQTTTSSQDKEYLDALDNAREEMRKMNGDYNVVFEEDLIQNENDALLTGKTSETGQNLDELASPDDLSEDEHESENSSRSFRHCHKKVDQLKVKQNDRSFKVTHIAYDPSSTGIQVDENGIPIDTVSPSTRGKNNDSSIDLITSTRSAPYAAKSSLSKTALKYHQKQREDEEKFLDMERLSNTNTPTTGPVKTSYISPSTVHLHYNPNKNDNQFDPIKDESYGMGQQGDDGVKMEGYNHSTTMNLAYNNNMIKSENVHDHGMKSEIKSEDPNFNDPNQDYLLDAVAQKAREMKDAQDSTHTHQNQNFNPELCAELELLETYYKSTSRGDNQWRSMTFRKAVGIIRSLPYRLETEQQIRELTYCPISEKDRKKYNIQLLSEMEHPNHTDYSRSDRYDTTRFSSTQQRVEYNLDGIAGNDGHDGVKGEEARFNILHLKGLEETSQIKYGFNPRGINSDSDNNADDAADQVQKQQINHYQQKDQRKVNNQFYGRRRRPRMATEFFGKRGIGPGIIKVMIETLRDGISSRRKSLLSQDSQRHLNNLVTIHGIGPKLAFDLTSQKFTHVLHLCMGIGMGFLRRNKDFVNGPYVIEELEQLNHDEPGLYPTQNPFYDQKGRKLFDANLSTQFTLDDQMDHESVFMSARGLVSVAAKRNQDIVMKRAKDMEDDDYKIKMENFLALQKKQRHLIYQAIITGVFFDPSLMRVINSYNNGMERASEQRKAWVEVIDDNNNNVDDKDTNNNTSTTLSTISSKQSSKQLSPPKPDSQFIPLDNAIVYNKRPFHNPLYLPAIENAVLFEEYDQYMFNMAQKYLITYGFCHPIFIPWMKYVYMVDDDCIVHSRMIVEDQEGNNKDDQNNPTATTTTATTITTTTTTNNAINMIKALTAPPVLPRLVNCYFPRGSFIPRDTLRIPLGIKSNALFQQLLLIGRHFLEFYRAETTAYKSRQRERGQGKGNTNNNNKTLLDRSLGQPPTFHDILPSIFPPSRLPPWVSVTQLEPSHDEQKFNFHLTKPQIADKIALQLNLNYEASAPSDQSMEKFGPLRVNDILDDFKQDVERDEMKYQNHKKEQQRKQQQKLQQQQQQQQSNSQSRHDDSRNNQPLPPPPTIPPSFTGNNNTDNNPQSFGCMPMIPSESHQIQFENPTISLARQHTVALLYNTDHQKRVKRSEVTAVIAYVQSVAKIISPDVHVICCGSYRRGKQSSGDVDVFITSSQWVGENESILSRSLFLRALLIALQVFNTPTFLTLEQLAYLYIATDDQSMSRFLVHLKSEKSTEWILEQYTRLTIEARGDDDNDNNDKNVSILPRRYSLTYKNSENQGMIDTEAFNDGMDCLPPLLPTTLIDQDTQQDGVSWDIKKELNLSVKQEMNDTNNETTGDNFEINPTHRITIPITLRDFILELFRPPEYNFNPHQSPQHRLALHRQNLARFAGETKMNPCPQNQQNVHNPLMKRDNSSQSQHYMNNNNGLTNSLSNDSFNPGIGDHYSDGLFTNPTNSQTPNNFPHLFPLSPCYQSFDEFTSQTIDFNEIPPSVPFITGALRGYYPDPTLWCKGGDVFQQFIDISQRNAESATGIKPPQSFHNTSFGQFGYNHNVKNEHLNGNNPTKNEFYMKQEHIKNENHQFFAQPQSSYSSNNKSQNNPTINSNVTHNQFVNSTEGPLSHIIPPATCKVLDKIDLGLLNAIKQSIYYELSTMTFELHEKDLIGAKNGFTAARGVNLVDDIPSTSKPIASKTNDNEDNDDEIVIVNVIDTTNRFASAKDKKKLAAEMKKGGNTSKDQIATTKLINKAQSQFRLDTTWMGFCQLPIWNPHSSQTHLRLDIKLFPVETVPFALLYFTGSDHFNRSMRYYANRNGWSLSEHALRPVIRSYIKSSAVAEDENDGNNARGGKYNHTTGVFEKITPGANGQQQYNKSRKLTNSKKYQDPDLLDPHSGWKKKTGVASNKPQVKILEGPGIFCQTEADVFYALQLPFAHPWGRNTYQ